jgi:hypothetical protein
VVLEAGRAGRKEAVSVGYGKDIRLDSVPSFGDGDVEFEHRACWFSGRGGRGNAFFNVEFGRRFLVGDNWLMTGEVEVSPFSFKILEDILLLVTV